ncbi:MAG: hypothetical protein ACRDF7_07795 [Candidatus Limnocylindrales bacterium]
MNGTPSPLPRVGAITALLAGAFVAVLRIVLSSGQDYPDATLTKVTFAALALGPGVIATVGWRRDAAPLLLAAAIGCGLLAVLSVAALPFLVPAVALLLGALRGRSTRATILGATLATGAFAAAWFSLLLLPAERCVESATSTTCGHIATTTDDVVALLLIVAAVSFAAISTVPREPRPMIPGDGHPADPRPPRQ